MKKFIVLASAMIFAVSITAFGQTEMPAAKKEQTKAIKTDDATLKQEQAKPAAISATQSEVTKEQKTKTDIAVNELPKVAQDYIAKSFPGKAIDKAMKITDESGMVKYKAAIGEMMLYFDADGKVINEGKKIDKADVETKTVKTALPVPEKE